MRYSEPPGGCSVRRRGVRDHEGSAEVSAAEFRQAMGHFATGVTVVTSIGDDDEPVGTTASAVTSLSLDPPLVARPPRARGGKWS